MARLPQPGGDTGNWGDVLNDFLSQAHAGDGTLKTDSVGATQLQPQSVTNAALVNNSITAAKLSDLGAANGVASLDTNAKLSDSQIPARLSEDALADSFIPISGEATKLGLLRFADTFPQVKSASDEPVTYDAASGAAWDVRKRGNSRLLHLVNNDPDSSGDMIAIGNDAGTGSSILLANKAAGAGLLVGNHPSASAPGISITNYSKSANSGTRIAQMDGASSIKFIANNGQGFPDAVTTLGSTTLTCATAAFTAADIGSVIMSTTSIDGMGLDIATTITAVANATTVTLSKPAISTSSKVNIVVYGRAYSTTQRFIDYIGPTSVPFQIVKVARTEFFQNVDFYPAGGVTTNQHYVRQSSNATLFYQYNGTNYTNTRWIMKANDQIALRMYAPAAAGTESVYTDMISAKKDALGFFGATAVAKPSSIPPDATDLASAITLLNYLKNNVVIPLGLAE